MEEETEGMNMFASLLACNRQAMLPRLSRRDKAREREIGNVQRTGFPEQLRR